MELASGGYFSKDADAIPPPSNHPGSTGAGPQQIPDYLTCLLRHLYAGQLAPVRTGHGTTDWFQIGKGVHQDCILSPCLFNLYVEYIMRNAGLDEAQAGIKDCQEKYQ